MDGMKTNGGPLIQFTYLEILIPNKIIVKWPKLNVIFPTISIFSVLKHYR